MPLTVTERDHWRSVLHVEFEKAIKHVADQEFEEIVEERLKALDDIVGEVGFTAKLKELEKLEQAKDKADEAYHDYGRRLVLAVTGENIGRNHGSYANRCTSFLQKKLKDRQTKLAHSKGPQAKIAFLQDRKAHYVNQVYLAKNLDQVRAIWEESRQYVTDLESFTVTREINEMVIDTEEIDDRIDELSETEAT